MGIRRTAEHARDRRGSRSIPSAASAVLITGLLLALCAGAGSAAAAGCPNEALRTEKSAALPDCRAYEQVTPVEKEYGIYGIQGEVPSGEPATGEPPLALTAAEGGAVAYTTQGPLPGANSASLLNAYVSRRGNGGWITSPVVPPVDPIPGQGNLPYAQAFTPDLSKQILLAANPPLLPGLKSGVDNLYLTEGSLGPYRLISVDQEDRGDRAFMVFLGANADYSKVVFESLEGFGGRSFGNESIYESSGGQIHDLGILPSGEPASVARAPLGVGGAEFRKNMVSDTGRRVYFIAAQTGALLDGELYVREDDARTFSVSASQRQVPDPNEPISSPARFVAATPDGSKSFFLSRRALTDDANTGRDPGGTPTDTGANLYSYDIETGRLSDVTVDTNPLDAETGAEVEGVLGVSEDGSYAYFVARGGLTSDAQRGSLNLYVWHEGGIHYIATLLSLDTANWTTTKTEITSRVTPDGKHLLVSSAAPLTAYDNTDRVTGEPDTEIYRYSAEGKALVCVSCRPDGARPLQSTAVFSPAALAGSNEYSRRYISDDGSTVVFGTLEGLVGRDTNGRADVYEYRDGQLHLLSTGTSQFNTRYEEMSANGTDVFIGTPEKLVPSDIDGLTDMYDVRRDGGYPGAASAAPSCSGLACPRQTNSQPPGPDVASAGFRGPGNVKVSRCKPPRKLVRRHGKSRCTKPNHAKHGSKHRSAGPAKGGAK